MSRRCTLFGRRCGLCDAGGGVSSGCGGCGSGGSVAVAAAGSSQNPQLLGHVSFIYLPTMIACQLQACVPTTLQHWHSNAAALARALAHPGFVLHSLCLAQFAQAGELSAHGGVCSVGVGGSAARRRPQQPTRTRPWAMPPLAQKVDRYFLRLRRGTEAYEYATCPPLPRGPSTGHV